MAITRQRMQTRGLRGRLLTIIASAAMLGFIAGFAGMAPTRGVTPAFAASLTGLAFSPTPATSVVGQTISFSASASTPNAGATMASFAFAFGDGSVITVAASPAAATTATGAASHAYTAANTYLASVTATDSTGAQGTTTTSVNVGAGQRIALTAAPSTTFAVVGQPVGFSVSASDPNPGATITSVTVNFGDGSGSLTVPNNTPVSHIFLSVGTFTPTVTATDNLGTTTTTSVQPVFVSATSSINNGFAPNGTVYNPATNSYVPVTSAAATGTVAVSMAQGWVLVAGPAGTVITGNTGPMYTFQAGDTTYQLLQPGAQLRAGAGYWAYFGTALTDALPLAPGRLTTVALPAGQFIMIGNPGSGTASVSGADFMVVFNASSNQYTNATTLGPGQGAWVWSWNGGTATITSS